MPTNFVCSNPRIREFECSTSREDCESPNDRDDRSFRRVDCRATGRRKPPAIVETRLIGEQTTTPRLARTVYFCPLGNDFVIRCLRSLQRANCRRSGAPIQIRLGWDNDCASALAMHACRLGTAEVNDQPSRAQLRIRDPDLVDTPRAYIA